LGTSAASSSRDLAASTRSGCLGVPFLDMAAGRRVSNEQWNFQLRAQQMPPGRWVPVAGACVGWGRQAAGASWRVKGCDAYLVLKQERRTPMGLKGNTGDSGSGASKLARWTTVFLSSCSALIRPARSDFVVIRAFSNSACACRVLVKASTWCGMQRVRATYVRCCKLSAQPCGGRLVPQRQFNQLGTQSNDADNHGTSHVRQATRHSRCCIPATSGHFVPRRLDVTRHADARCIVIDISCTGYASPCDNVCARRDAELFARI
jgi:hypothetical protein